MSFPRRYALVILAPPLFTAFPVAAIFAQHVTGLSAGAFARVAAGALVTYVVALLVASVRLISAAGRFDDDLTAGRSANESASACIHTTAIAAAVLWLVCGVVLAVVLSAIVLPTFLGFQYFVEASLIMAAPAMAWAYWYGKHMVLRRAGEVTLVYTGTVWSVGVKIALVFIGFFVVATGALVLVLSSRIARVAGLEAAHDATRFGFAVAGGTALIFALATWFLARDVRRPMGELMALAQALSEGRFDVEPRVFADDETGELAQSFGITRRNLRDLVARVGSRGGAITDRVRLMTDGTGALLNGAAEQSEVAHKADTALATVRADAQSTLTEVERVTELTLDSAGRATELRASFNEVAQRMDELMQSVEKSSSAAAQIDASARTTADGATSLASVANEVLTFVAEMNASVVEITDTARSTAQLSTRVRDRAEAGRTAVEATVAGIRGAQDATRRTAGAFESLQKSLGQIDQILVFIDDVTNRTNLLSLNAAIIAAQAGANDFGFSVIADEVRQLADRTRSATKEIAGIVRNLKPVAAEALDAIEEGVRNVDTTVKLANDASQSLESIAASASDSFNMSQMMTRALQEQSEASGHLHQVTAQMSDSIREIERATAGQADAMRLLASESESVRDIATGVKKSTEEQNAASIGIAHAMEQIVTDIRMVRDRLERQLALAEDIAGASRATITIAGRNNTIAQEFTSALQALVASGQDFDAAVKRFRA